MKIRHLLVSKVSSTLAWKIPWMEEPAIRPGRPPAKSVSEFRTGGQIPHSGHPTLLLTGGAGSRLEACWGKGGVLL